MFLALARYSNLKHQQILPGWDPNPYFSRILFNCDKYYSIAFLDKTGPKADYFAIYFLLIICIFLEALGYLAPSIIRFDQNYIFWGLIGVKKCSSLILPIIESHQMFFFGLPSQLVLKVIGNAFARDLGGIIQQHIGCRLGYKRSRSRPYLYGLATLIHSWGTAHPCVD